MTTDAEPRRATDREIALAKQWVEANTPVQPLGFDPTSAPEYAQALETIIFANGGRYAPAVVEQLQDSRQQLELEA